MLPFPQTLARHFCSDKQVKSYFPTLDSYWLEMYLEYSVSKSIIFLVKSFLGNFYRRYVNVVMGGDSRLRGRGFESRHRILNEWHFFTYIVVKICNVYLKRSKINDKRGRGWLFFKQIATRRFTVLTKVVSLHPIVPKVIEIYRWLDLSGDLEVNYAWPASQPTNGQPTVDKKSWKIPTSNLQS